MVAGLLLTLLAVATQAPFAGISSSLCLLVLLAAIRVNLRNSVSLGSVALSVTSLSSSRIRYDPIMFATLRFIDLSSKSEGSQLWLLASCLLLTTFVQYSIYVNYAIVALFPTLLNAVLLAAYRPQSSLVTSRPLFEEVVALVSP